MTVTVDSDVKITKQVQKFLDLVMDSTDLGNCNVYSFDDGIKHSVELEYWSDLGEDVLIYLSMEDLNIENIVHAMYEEVENFDAEDHATMLYNRHGEGGTPTSLRALLEDADEQQEMLNTIYDKMLELRELVNA